MDKLEQQVV